MPKLNCFASFFTLVGLFLGFSIDGSERPNIFWITSEDNNVNWVGCYGNPHAQTPYIDKLASEGFQYMNCFANAPVCAPSRSGWITGVHPVSLGTLPMRSRYPIPHDQVKYYPDYLKDGWGTTAQMSARPITTSEGGLMTIAGTRLSSNGRSSNKDSPSFR